MQKRRGDRAVQAIRPGCSCEFAAARSFLLSLISLTASIQPVLRCGHFRSWLRMRCDQRLADPYDPRAQAVGSDALRGDPRSLQHQIELISEQLRLCKTGRLTERDESRAPRDLVLLDDAARRMILLRQFDRGIGERASASAGCVIRHVPDEGPQL